MTQRVRYAIVTTVLLLTFAMLVPSSYGRLYPDGRTPEPFVIKGRVTVQFEDGVDPQDLGLGTGKVRFTQSGLAEIADSYDMSAARKLFPWRVERPAANSGLTDLSRFYELRFAEDIEVQAVVEALLRDPNVRHAEPVWAVPVEYVTPDDPDWDEQWHVDVTMLRSAWELETGSDSIKLGVIDTGVNYKHPDLYDNIWVNPGEDVDGDGVVYDSDDLNGIDDDGNGLVDDLVGYDFFTGVGTPPAAGEDGGTPDSDPNDFDGHGTHCAGISAAVTNNTTGATGIGGGWSGGVPAMSRGCRIMCLRAGGLANDGYGYVNTNDCATAMDYAVTHGAKVINCSWGGSSALYYAFGNAIAQEVTVVHAAGNDSADDPDWLDGAFGQAALSVAATRADDKKAWFSNYGDWVDVSAPGMGIYSTVSYEYVPSYDYLDGTSMAAPVVSGIALLIRSMMPSLTKDQVDSIIVATTDNIDGINPTYVGLLGSGRVNAYQALYFLANAKFEADVLEGNLPLEVNFSDLSPNSPTAWHWYFGDGDSADVQNPTHTYTEPGAYTVSLKVEEPNGLGEEHLTNYIWVQADTARIDSVESNRNSRITLPVYLNHTALVKQIIFSFQLPNTDGVSLYQVSLEGCRTEAYFNRTYTGWSSGAQQYEVTLSPSSGSTVYLPPDTGAILNLILDVALDATPGAVVTIDTATWSSHTPLINTIYGSYWPEFTAGKVVVAETCCGFYTGGYTGNTNCDEEGKRNLADISKLIDRVYISKTALCCEENGNVNGDVEDKVNLADISKLIDHVYISKTETALCQ